MQVILYYHCDEWQSLDSYRLQAVFRNNESGRKKLLKLIQSQIADDVIEATTEDAAQITWRLLHTFPSAVNDCIRYGCAHVEEAL